jgi:hypothetical protein
MQRPGRRRVRAAFPLVLACAVVVLAGFNAFQFTGLKTRAIVPAGIAAAAGECEAAGLIPVADTGLCTHGSDPALSGGAVEPAEAGDRSSLAVCTGNGTSGRRVQVLYARQSGLASRYAQYLESFRIWSAETSQIYSDSAARTGGTSYIRFVHNAGCAIDVKSIVLPNAYASDFGTIVSQLASLGYSNPKRKYLVFLDLRSYVDCGLSTLLPDDSPGSGNRNNNATGYSLIYPGCWADTHILVHELGHAFGAVQDSAPHATGASHCYDEWDVMCYSDGGGRPLVRNCHDLADQGLLDCKNDDYFHTSPPPGSYLATHWNIAKSGWLGTTGAPPASSAPPHDAIENARVIDTLPFVDESNTLRATKAKSDPIANGEACWGDFDKTVWYRFNVPAGGTYTFETVDSGYNTVMAAFTGPPNRLKRLSCSGDISWDNWAARIQVSNVAAGTTVYIMVGAFPRQVGARPPGAGGYLRLTVKWSGQLALGRSSGRLSSSIPFTISGFPANSDVALTFDGAPLMNGASQLTARTDSRGGARGTFKVPSASAGAHTIGAVIGSISVGARFDVTPHIRLSPTRGGAGTVVTVRLYGFQAGEKVAVRWRLPNGRLQTLTITAAAVKPAKSVVTGADGSATGTVAIPPDAASGNATIQADGLTSKLKVTALFTVSGPAATATPTRTPQSTATSTAIAEPTATSTEITSSAEEPTSPPANTPAPTETPTEAPTATPTSVPTEEPSPTATAAPTDVPTEIPPPTPEPTQTP